MKIIPSLVLCCLAGAAQADAWALRSSDTVLAPADLDLIADGARLTFFDDGVSLFSQGGAYSYTYANDGGTAFGQFRVAGEGQICIAFRNGFGRCDMYVRAGGRLTLLTEGGDRYPVKIEEGTTP